MGQVDATFDGAGSHNVGLFRVVSNLEQVIYRLRDLAGTDGGKNLREMRLPDPVLRVVLANARRGPLRVFILVTADAGVGRANHFGKVWPWHPKAVIASPVNHHVVTRWHVAVKTFRALGICWMKVMRSSIVILFGHLLKVRISLLVVALGTDCIAVQLQFVTMRVMAVGAGYTLGMHS